MYSREHQCTGISYYIPSSSYIHTMVVNGVVSVVGNHTSHVTFMFYSQEPGTGHNKIGAKSESNNGTTILINRIGKEYRFIPDHDWILPLKQGELTLQHLFSGNCVF